MAQSQHTTSTTSTERDTYDIDLGGKTYTAYRPKQSVILFGGAAASEWSGDQDQALAVLQLLKGSFSAADFEDIFQRLRSWDEPDFDMDEQFAESMRELLDHWQNNQGNREQRRAKQQGSKAPRSS